MKTYSYEEALSASIDYFGGDDLAAKVFVDKYALRNSENELLEQTPTDMHWRLAKEFARIEKKKFKKPMSKEEIFSYLDKFEKIIPQGSPMYGIGNKYQIVSHSNCYVIPSPLDSYLGICYTDAQITQISSRRGGVGWDISTLRPKGFKVANAAKTTSGAISFMSRFSNTIREVGQFGRRGASLQSISVHHPDVLDFITVKQNLDKVTGSNITVQFTDEFLNAVENNKDVELRWPIDGNVPEIVKNVKARKIWDEFIKCAHKTAEPGACYIDTVHKQSTSYPYAKFGYVEISSNPCGEQYLPAYACCRLIAINLYSYVIDKFNTDAKFDFQHFIHDVKIMQRLADNMVDLDLEAVDKIIKKIKSDSEPDHIKQLGLDLWKNIKKTSEGDRRTGCGFTGLGDAIAALNMKYGSDESLKFVENLQEAFRNAAFESSVEMSKELGAFPFYDKDLDYNSEFIQELSEQNPALYKQMRRYGRRNMTLLTIAPTGTVSCLTQTSSGLEPVFMLEYMRRKKGNPGDKNFKSDFVDESGDHWQHFSVFHKGLKDWMEATGKTKVEDSPYHKATAHDIDYVQRVKIQALLQKYIDNSISTTINLPNNIDVETVSKLYLQAWKLGCKGLTIYRDGCRDGVLVKAKDKFVSTEAPERPDELPCDFYHISVKGRPYFVCIGKFENRPYEVFAGRNGHLGSKSKHGIIRKMKRPKCYKAILDDGTEICPLTIACDDSEEALSRMVSTALRHGANIEFVVDQLEKTSGEMVSFAKSLARALKKYIPDGVQSSEECPECSNVLIRLEGCLTCKSCGYSKCN